MKRFAQIAVGAALSLAATVALAAAGSAPEPLMVHGLWAGCA